MTPRIVDAVVPGRHGVVPVRLYQPDAAAPASQPTVVWLHGGGFTHGNLDMPESHVVAQELARSASSVLAVDYRRVPVGGWWRRPKTGVVAGVRHPVPLEDVVDVVTQTLSEHGDRDLVLGGASAGACLAAAAALRLVSAGSPGPARLLCVYGIFHAALPRSTAEQRARLRGRHGLLQYRPAMIKLMSRNYVGAGAITDPFAFPGGHGLHGMPPTLVLDADRDSLRASGERFAAELAAAGTPVRYEVVPGARHGFLNRPTTASFADAIARIRRWLQQGLRDQLRQLGDPR
jgi:acetyl esterase